MKIIESLYSFWIGERTETPRTRQSWIDLDKAMLELVSDEQIRQKLMQLIEDHCYAVECGGFTEGFRAGMKLAEELREIDRKEPWKL